MPYPFNFSNRNPKTQPFFDLNDDEDEKGSGGEDLPEW